MNPCSLLLIRCDLHKGLSRIILLTELDNALQVVIEQILLLDVEFILTEAFLITLYHHEYNLLIFVWALKEVLQVTLFFDFFRCLFDIIYGFVLLKLQIFLFTLM